MTNTLINCAICGEDTVDTSDEYEYRADDAGEYHVACYEAYGILASQTWGGCESWETWRFRQTIADIIKVRGL